MRQSLSPVRVNLVPSLFLEEHAGQSLGTLLQGQPGVVVRSYGGGIGLQVASFRGMGPEHTQILLEGVPLVNPQNGLFDLRMLTTDGIDRIEVVRGGNSAVYGRDAIGGVIDVIPRGVPAMAEASLGTSMGSFGSRRYWMSTAFPLGQDGGISLGSSTAYGRGNYAFSIWDGASLQKAQRENSDYRFLHTYARGEWMFSKGMRFSLFADRTASDQGTPGAVLTIANQGRARQTDERLMMGFGLEGGKEEILPWKVAGLLQNSYERYVDFLSLPSPDNYYKNVTGTMVASTRYTIWPDITVNGGVEFSNTSATGNAMPETKTRSNIGFFGGSEIRWKWLSSQVSLYPLVRYDQTSGIGGALSPKLGLNVRSEVGDVGPFLRSAATLHSSVGKDFRVPTFNQLYYAGAGGEGNPHLVPERSTSLEGGLTLDGELAGQHQFDVTYYRIVTKDRLLWLPTSSALVWSPVNVGRTTSHGAELEWRWILPGDQLRCEGNYSTITSRKTFRSSSDDPTFGKQLMYVPLETASISLLGRIPLHWSLLTAVSFWCNDTYTGTRFATEDNSVVLPGFHLVKAQAIAELELFGASIKVKYEIDNVLDQEYELISRYPMPLRNHGVSLSIHKQY